MTDQIIAQNTTESKRREELKRQVKRLPSIAYHTDGSQSMSEQVFDAGFFGNVRNVTDGIHDSKRREPNEYCPKPCGHSHCSIRRPSYRNKDIAQASDSELKARITEIKIAMGGCPRERGARRA